jgi:hypothetical protein
MFDLAKIRFIDESTDRLLIDTKNYQTIFISLIIRLA